jgi:hypothetical protein
MKIRFLNWMAVMAMAAAARRDENENDNLRFSEIAFEFFPIFMPKRK